MNPQGKKQWRRRPLEQTSADFGRVLLTIFVLVIIAELIHAYLFG